MSKARAVRLSDEVDAWLQAYASDRGVSPSDVLRTAVESFRLDAMGGVPEIAPSAPSGPARASEPAENQWAAIMAARQARLNRGAA